jgi:acyl carrier protein
VAIQTETTDLGAIENHLRRFIAESFLSDGRAHGLQDDTDLFALLDSLQVLRLVVMLETTYGFKVSDGELAPENLSTIERIAQFVVRRVGV